MKRLLLALFILTLSLSNIYAQADTTSACVTVDSIPRAVLLLDSLTRQFASFPAYTITFDLAVSNPDIEVTDHYDGNLWLQGNAYRLDILGSERYFDGEMIYTYLPDMDEVTLRRPDDGEPDALLFDPAVLQSLSTHFTPTLLDENETGIRLLLMPKQQASFKKLELSLQPDFSLYQINAYNKDGTIAALTVEEFEVVASGFDTDTFVFDLASHPETEVIDLR